MLITRLGGQTLINPPKPQENGDKKTAQKIVSPSEVVTRQRDKDAATVATEQPKQSVVNPTVEANLLPLKPDFIADAGKVINNGERR